MTAHDRTDAIRNRLTAAVTASGRSVAEIEAAAGLKRDGLRDFLAARKRGLSLVDAASIAAVLGVSLEWLAGNSDERGAA